MKNKIQLLLFSILLFPLFVYASNESVSFNCPKEAKMDTTVSCTLVVTGTSGDTASMQIVPSDSYFNTATITEDDIELVNGRKEIPISITTKSKAGNGNISITNINIGGTSINNVTKSIKVLNNVSSLSNITIDNSSIPGFSSTSYTYTLESDKKEIELGVQKTSSSDSIVTGAGKKTLNCGSNKFSLVVVAEDKSTSTYNLNINRTCNSDTTLKGISISTGTLTPTFSSSKTSYTVNVSKDIDKITIKAIKNDDTQKVEGEVSDKELDYGENKITLKVISEDGKTSSYTVTVKRAEGRNKSAYLKALKLDEGKITFNKKKLEYDVRVLYEVTSLKITATPEATKAKVEIDGNTNLEVGKNKVTIKVTSELGEEKTYILHVTRLKQGETLGDNPNIKSIKIKGYKFKFNSDRSNYTLKIKNDKKLDFDIEMEENTSKFTITGNKNLKDGSVIKITGESEDGTERVYKIEIEKDFSLLLLIIGAVSILVAGILIFIIKKKDKGPKVKKDKVKISKIEEEDLLTREALDTDLEKTKVMDTKEIQREFEMYNPEPIVKEVKIEEEKKDTTKVCTLCGHIIPESTKVCPYCKKKFD